jgi:predicted glycogen debranching enzyme
MSYVKINKQQLINLEYSLGLELLRSNRAGSYSNTTLIGANTRKYHGLLVSPVPNLDDDNHVILSDVDETIIQRGAEFRLGLHRYPNSIYEPKGHKYAMDFELDPIPGLIYRVGGVKLKKETMLVTNEERILIRYTLLDAHSPTTIRLQPFLAFRNIHTLSKENLYANTKSQSIPNGIKIKLYEGYPYLHLQLNKKAEFIGVPDWNRNIEYIEEEKRGYEYREDLFVPGFFEFSIKKGESVVFSAGLKETIPSTITRQFAKELDGRTPRDSYENNLRNAAQQFIVRFEGKSEIMAGYPWYGRGGRDTFISLPGISIAEGSDKTCLDVLDTMTHEMYGPLFPNIGRGTERRYNSADAPLWFFWTLQHLEHSGRSKSFIGKKYWPAMKAILNGFVNGTEYNIHVADNHLIWAGNRTTNLTWMDSKTESGPVTSRHGFAVEINALWYNAVSYSLEIAAAMKDKEFIKAWKNKPLAIQTSFIRTFWSPEKGILADYSNEIKTDWSVRPNMIFAASLPHSMLDKSQAKSICDLVRKELVTSRGLRTLTPTHPNYKGLYVGNQTQRDEAFHQGTAWPWLLGHFAEAYLKIYEKSGISFIRELYHGFEEEMSKNALGTISQIYDGDPPHHAGGAISFASSVAEIIRMKQIINETASK